MAATTIHFVRHGEVYNPQRICYERLPNFHLSQRGRYMAHITARYLVQNPQTNTITAIYSSPLERACETAQEILDAFNAQRYEQDMKPLSMVTDERLIELGNVLRGKHMGRFKNAYWHVNNWWLLRNPLKPSWGESYQHVGERMSSFVRDMLEQYHDVQIVAVSHQAPIWAYRHLLEVGHPEHNAFFRCAALASVTSITYDCDTSAVMSITYVDPPTDMQQHVEHHV